MLSHLVKRSLKTRVFNGYNNSLPYEGAIIYLNILPTEDKFLHFFAIFNNAAMRILLRKSWIYFFLGYTVRNWITELQLPAARGSLLEQEILLWVRAKFTLATALKRDCKFSILPATCCWGPLKSPYALCVRAAMRAEAPLASTEIYAPPLLLRRAAGNQGHQTPRRVRVFFSGLYPASFHHWRCKDQDENVSQQKGVKLFFFFLEEALPTHLFQDK